MKAGFNTGKLLRGVRQIAFHSGPILRYGIAALCVLAATGVRVALNPILGVQTPHLPFALAVIVAALFGGRRAGVAATALTVPCAAWFLLPPYHSFAVAGPAARWGLLLAVLTGTLISLLVGSLRESFLARTKAEEGLRGHAQLINSSHDAIITTNSSRRILTWNKGAEQIYGWTEHEVLGNVIHEFLQTAGPVSTAEVDEVLDHIGQWEGELSHRTKDGRRIRVESRQVLVRNEENVPTGILEINRDITARRQAEQALRESQERLRFAQKAGRSGTFEWDPQSDVSSWSDEMLDLYGLTREEFGGTSQAWVQALLPEDREAGMAAIRTSVETGLFELEFRVQRRDSREVRWMYARAEVRFDESGKPSRMVGINIDITERKRAEEAVRESEEQFRTLANSIPQLCSMANADGWIFWCNARWYDYTGVTSEQSEGWGWRSLHDPEVLPEVMETWQHSIKTGEPFEMVFPLRGADGVFRPFLSRAVPARDRDGKVVRWFITNTEISEQRATEEALRKSHDQEHARAAELQAIMDAIPVAVFISHDPECRNIIGNKRAYELLRLEPGSNLSKSAPDDEKPRNFQAMKDGREIQQDELPMQKVAVTRQPVNDYEFEFRFDDGSRREMIGNAVPLLDEKGWVTGAVGIFVDVTELKQAEERLRRLQKLESIGLLAGGVAHDFNNLLTVIMGNASSGLLESPSSQHYRDILSASERAAHLTKQLLAYAGKGRFVIRTFDLTGLVSRSMHLLSASVPKRVRLVFNPCNEELPVQADPGQIEQIVINLVINAGEAIPPRTDGQIEIATHSCNVTPEVARRQYPAFDITPGLFLCLEVKDNGTGIDESTLAQMFDPFFSTKFTGRGLGLAAVHGIVRSSKGFIEVESSPGAGSTFRVFLPSAETKRIARVGAAADRPAVLPSRPEFAIVLVVDDEELVRSTASAVLRQHGHEVLEAKDGRDALEVLARATRRPAVVVLDLAMPVMGGDELVPILVRDYPDLKIIISSGYPEEEARKGFPPGAVTGFLEKPYTASALAASVEQAVKGPESQGNVELRRAG